MAKLKSLRSWAIGLTALAITSLIANAAGMFPGLPIVGGASYCSSYSGTGSGSITSGNFSGPSTCNVTVPAGPTVLTGSELVPADTQLSGGQQPQTVLLSMAALGTLPYTYVVPSASLTTFTIAATTGKLVMDPASSITAVTITLPASTSLVDGQQFRVSSSQVITTFTVTAGSGTTISNAPTIITPSTTGPYGYAFIYVAAQTKWYRMQ